MMAHVLQPNIATSFLALELRQDIRSFFSTASKKKLANESPTVAAPVVKRKALVISSDEEDSPDRHDSKRPKKPASDSSTPHVKKRAHQIIDSDDENANVTPKKKINLATLKNRVSSTAAPPGKAVNIADVFGSAPIKRVERPKVVKKPNETLPEIDIDSLFDDDFGMEVVDEHLLNGSKKSETVDTNNKSPAKMNVEHTEVIEGTPDAKPKGKPKTPKTMNFNTSDSQQDEDRHERKRQVAIMYQKFKNRGGATNPGSKEIPKVSTK